MSDIVAMPDIKGAISRMRALAATWQHGSSPHMVPQGRDLKIICDLAEIQITPQPRVNPAAMASGPIAQATGQGPWSALPGAPTEQRAAIEGQGAHGNQTLGIASAEGKSLADIRTELKAAPVGGVVWVPPGTNPKDI